MTSYFTSNKLFIVKRYCVLIICKIQCCWRGVIQYCDKEMEHKAVKKKRDTFSFRRFIVNVDKLSRVYSSDFN